MRIFPVSSGKGGVGKTTVALNLALSLSRKYNTVLIDLDSGTSSVRNFLNMNIKKDIFHFLKKGSSIHECLTPLSDSLDPEREFKNFKLIASPKNFIYDIVNFTPNIKTRLINGINSLKCDFVILDLRAGLDQNILTFLPPANSGILVFTPKVKAASYTASEIVKADIVKTIRYLIQSKIESFPREYSIKKTSVSFLYKFMEKLEDNYDAKPKNIDSIFTELSRQYRGNPFLKLLKNYLRNYRIYFILNQFNSVEESSDNVIKPFISRVFDTISQKALVYNLGWVVADKNIRESAEERIPYMVMQHYRRKKEIQNINKYDSDLRHLLGIENKQKIEVEPQVNHKFTHQIDILKNMYLKEDGKNPENNFEFISRRIENIVHSSIHNLGMRTIFSKSDIINKLFYRKDA